MIDKETKITDKQFKQKKYFEKKIETDNVSFARPIFVKFASRII